MASLSVNKYLTTTRQEPQQDEFNFISPFCLLMKTHCVLCAESVVKSERAYTQVEVPIFRNATESIFDTALEIECIAWVLLPVIKGAFIYF